MNVIPERDIEDDRDVNWNILPFPVDRLIFSNVTPSHDILPLPISNSGVLFVPYFDSPPVSFMFDRERVPDVTEMREEERVELI